jgi:hypothetical protein
MQQTSTPTRRHDPQQVQAAKQGVRRARLSAWASFLAVIVGAGLMWRTPWIDLPSMSSGILATYAATAGLVWLAGVQPLVGPLASPQTAAQIAIAHARLPVWAPAAWAFVHFAWPGVAATAMAYAVGAGDLGLTVQAVCLLAALCLATAAVACLSQAGVALTMPPPQPRHAWLPAGFRGLRTASAWVAVLATVVLNLLVLQGPVRLLERVPSAGV